MTPPVAVLVLNWFGREQTLAALRSLACSTVAPGAVLVVDNGCSELSSAEVAAAAGQGTVLRLAENRGFAGGCNAGMAHLFERGAEQVLLLNHDARVEPQSLSHLLEAARSHGRRCLLQALVMQARAPGRIECAGIAVDRASGRIRQIAHGCTASTRSEAVRAVPAATGTALLVPRSVWESVGGFDERYFAYLEDVDLSLRARAAGFAVGVALRARVAHQGKAASGGATSILSIYYATRNHLLLSQERFGGPPGVRRLRAGNVAALNLAYAATRPAAVRVAALRAAVAGIRDFRRRRFGPAPQSLCRLAGLPERRQ